MATISQKERAERLFRWKQDSVKALSEYGTKEQAARVLTAKQRAERLGMKRVLLQKPGRACGTTHDNTRTH